MTPFRTSKLRSSASAILLRILSCLRLASPQRPPHPRTGNDQEANSRSTPPPEEHIDLRCIWGFEFYTPSHMKALERSLSNLGWTASNDPGNRGDPIVWLRGLRGHRYGGSILNLGFLTTETPETVFMNTRAIPELPSGIAYAQGRIASITPSLVAIALCFALDDSLPTELNDILRKDRTSFWEPISGGYALHDPRSQKQQDIATLRAELQRQTYAWFKKYLPGVLTTESDELPTCELITATVARPYSFSNPAAPEWDSYQRLIGFEVGPDAWHSQDVHGLVFDNSDDSWHPHLVISESDLLSAVGDDYGPDRSGSVSFLNLDIASMLQVWAIRPLLEHLTKVVAAASTPAGRSPEKVLDLLRRGQLSRMDVAALSNELSDEARESAWVWAQASGFTRTEPISGKQRTLMEDLVYFVQRQSVWLKETDRSVRENSTQYGTLLAAVESIRLQKSIWRLTWLLSILAVVAVGMTIASLCGPGSP